MYPFFRLGKTIIKGMIKEATGKPLAITDTGEIELTASLHDIDNYLEMNNGRIFTLFDLGRMDFAVRSGLGKKLLKKRWGLVVAGSTIQYRRRVRAFEKITIKTRVAAIDERWIYIEQSMWSKGKACSSALLRTGVTNFATGKVIETKTVLTALGYADLSMPPDAWVQAWIDADKLRPFPSSENNA